MSVVFGNGKRAYAEIDWKDGAADEPSDMCPICFESLDDGAVTRDRGCGHALHTACRQDVLVRSMPDRWACPICREPLYVNNEERARIMHLKDARAGVHVAAAASAAAEDADDDDVLAHPASAFEWANGEEADVTLPADLFEIPAASEARIRAGFGISSLQLYALWSRAALIMAERVAELMTDSGGECDEHDAVVEYIESSVHLTTFATGEGASGVHLDRGTMEIRTMRGMDGLNRFEYGPCWINDDGTMHTEYAPFLFRIIPDSVGPGELTYSAVPVPADNPQRLLYYGSWFVERVLAFIERADPPEGGRS
jgi:uncharacterized protein YbaR (Trm112 family)